MGTDHVDKEAVFQDWKSGMKRKDIAEKHQMKEETLKAWVSRDFKKRADKKTKKKGTPEKTKGAPKEARKGAPKGNKNAVGNKGRPQPRNQNNFKHGAYAEVYGDTLDEDEIALIDSLNYDEECELERQIGLLTVREKRLLQQIKIFKEKEGGLAIDSISVRELKIEGNLNRGEDQKHSEKTTKTVATFDVVLKLESTLTTVQGRKTKCIDSLHKIRQDMEAREEKAREREQELGNSEVEDVVIYFPEKRDINGT